jgi:hypothetical protein
MMIAFSMIKQVSRVVGANDFQYEVVVNLSDHGFLSCDPDQYH